MTTPANQPDPAHNVAAFRAARDWAHEHRHQQPDDRMLKAYGRALLADLADRFRARALAYDDTTATDAERDVAHGLRTAAGMVEPEGRSA